MRILAAYLGVVLIWATTPLAIKWSGEGPGWLFGAASRMTLGLCCMVLVLAVRRRPLPRHRPALLGYLVGAVQLYGAMLATYWAAQFIPSGWLSVVFGLTPLITALLAAVWLGERSLTPGRLLAYALGVAGLLLMFGSALDFGPGAARGIAGVLLASFLQSLSSVWIQRLDARLSAVELLTGSLLLAVPAYLLTYALAGGRWPEVLPMASLWSIVYLGGVATTLGFGLYFYVLKHLAATRVALITLVTPVLALFLGHAVNAEPLNLRVVQGTALILGALLLHEAAGRRRSRRITAPRRSSPGSIP